MGRLRMDWAQPFRRRRARRRMSDPHRQTIRRCQLRQDAPAHCFARRALALLLLATLALSVIAPTPVAAGTDLSFSIGDKVSAEDAAYVREGIALAEDYVATTLTDISDEELVVNVRNSEDTPGLDSTAFSGGSYIAIFTGAAGWSQVAPF